MIGALGGPLPIPGSLGAVGGIAGMLIAYGVHPRDAAVGAILLHQAIGLLVPLVGGAIAYTIIRWHLGPLHCLRTTYLASEGDRSPPPPPNVMCLGLQRPFLQRPSGFALQARLAVVTVAGAQAANRVGSRSCLTASPGILAVPAETLALPRHAGPLAAIVLVQAAARKPAASGRPPAAPVGPKQSRRPSPISGLGVVACT